MTEQLYKKTWEDCGGQMCARYVPVDDGERYTRGMLVHALEMACSKIREPICPLELAKQVDNDAFYQFMGAFECAERCDDNTARCWGAYFLETARTAEEEL